MSVRGTTAESLPAPMAETQLTEGAPTAVALATTRRLASRAAEIERSAGEAPMSPLTMYGLLLGAGVLLALAIWQGIRQSRA